MVLTAREVFRGHDGLRASAHRLWKALGDGSSYRFTYALADDRLALLEGSGSDEDVLVRCGVDSYLIEDGWIRVQTIHYRVEDSRCPPTATCSPAHRMSHVHMAPVPGAHPRWLRPLAARWALWRITSAFCVGPHMAAGARARGRQARLDVSPSGVG